MGPINGDKDCFSGDPPGKKKRSRSGCKNCRLRGVKCDEIKPECKRCLSYGVVCSYNKKTATEDLQFSSEQEMVMTSNLHVSRNRIVPEISRYVSYWPTRADELFNKFQLITAATVSVGPRTELYRTSVVERARTSPYMFHTLMALTSMHLRSLTIGASANPTREEAEHCYKAVSLFAKELANVRSSEQQGTLLCASALIYNMTFANVEAKTPEEAWPLAPSSPADLGWLKISNAKRKVTALAVPLGSDPLFTALSSSLGPEIAARETVSAEPSVLPLGFVSLFGLGSASRNLENPYFLPAIELSRIFDTDDTIRVTLGWIGFLNEVSDAFKDLLYQKDPRALLLLACWFSKLSNMPVWWYRQRAILEGKAICLYLERCDVEELNFQVLLRLVKGRFFRLPEWDVYPRDLDDFASNPVYSIKSSLSSPASNTPGVGR
ncbi:MAG: hypothetical protein GOMPHAMPRED_007661 [Gomphillus americanus]|uniref:Zn(2)-C6 fungal-type domain-containing protein n=1 Tax=Gomphillus americanus TaxID=1940652 RepID=A0A8H3I2E1_9LECA|nr:MAG: hypothetical protein GOMPHAMPRED_007661 [Gomphillus americanus]